MTNAENATRLFDPENLPTDQEFLKDLRRRIDDILGESIRIDLSQEIVTHYTTTKDLCDTLVADAASGEKGAAGAAVSAVNALTNVMVKIADLRKLVASQEAYQLLIATIIDTLAEVDMDLRKQIITAWRQKLEEMHT